MSTETININGNEYAVADLSNETVAFINRVQELRTEVSLLQTKIIESNMAIEAYSKAIVENLPAEEEVAEVEAVSE